MSLYIRYSSPYAGGGGSTSVTSVGTYDSQTPAANGATISGSSIYFQSASGSVPGMVNTSSQTLAGAKTFSGALVASSTLNVTGVLTASSKINADAGIGLSASGTLALGADSNSTIINIGHSGATVNVIGTTFYENVTNLNVASKVITLNVGGAAGSGSSVGLQIEENSVNTGYILTSGDRNSWLLKAPNTAGIATITAGASGITLAGNVSGTNTGDVTLGTANGLSLSGQVLSLGLSSTSTTGALSSTDWNTFNNKQSTLTLGNLTDAGTDGITITGGTGAVVGSGTSISQHVADTTHNGYLSSTDWNTFNGKQSALTFGSISTSTSGVTVGSGANSTVGPNVTVDIAAAGAGSAGLVTTGAQTFAGAKTFSSAPIMSALTASQAVVTDGSKNLASLGYASANTASTLVQRDGSGNFTAGTITAALSGNASTATAPASGSAHGAVTLDGSGNFQSVAPGSSGNVLTSDGTDWVSSAPTGATIIAARVSSTTQAYTANALTSPIGFSNVDYNTGSFTFANSNSRCTVPVTGIYEFSFGMPSAAFNPGAADTIYVQAFVNGSYYQEYRNTILPGANDEWSVRATDSVSLTAGDYLELKYYNAQVSSTLQGSKCYWTIAKVN